MKANGLSIMGMVALVCCMAEGVRGGQEAAVAMPTDVRATRDLLLLAYPELTSLEVQITSARRGDVVVAAVERMRAPRLMNSPAERVTPLVEVIASFVSGRELRSFSASGALVAGPQNDRLAELLRTNRGWTDTQARAWLRVGAAKAGPDVDFGAANLLNLDDWRPFVGGTAAFGTARFRLREAQPGPDGTQALVARPGWSLTAASVTGAGAPVSYDFDFEPFEGRLVAVTRR